MANDWITRRSLRKARHVTICYFQTGVFVPSSLTVRLSCEAVRDSYSRGVNCSPPIFLTNVSHLFNMLKERRHKSDGVSLDTPSCISAGWRPS
jgi:hypothetical protein